MRINTNVPALISYNALNNTNKALQTSIERLSTGLRINSAADDAAGLAISEKMRAQYRGLDQAASNAQDGISMIQTAEGALNETHSILQRMRELSVQAANDTLTQEDRGFIQLEINELRDEIDRISTTTQFNKKQLLDGSAAVLWSSDKLGTKVIVRGGLREIDQFGQKLVKEGNYKIDIVAEDGQAEVLKTDIFKLKHSSTDINGTIGSIAKGTTQLKDIDKFWDANGKFLLDDPKTITITQGDGKQANFTIYSTDTLDDLVTKLNKAIEGKVVDGGLEQDYYDPNTHAVYVLSAASTWFADSNQSVEGTIVINSSVTGAAGRLTFSGDEDIIKALSLSVISDASENKFEVTVTDAHSGTPVYNGDITGNVLYGGIHDNIDVEFDTMAGISVTDIDQNGVSFVAATYTTYVHLADNTTVFQIGANQGEDMAVHIGDMSARALGLAGIQVTDRESAARSITMIDNAIGRVSTQRAKLGAYQNRLEHSINNLTVSSTNLKASESRIRDADMAKEMMTFTKLNVLSQAGNAMLAQANQLPQNVLSLLR
ncbi:MAG: flagellin [Synergistaceae bacterium]|jgi:flagellin-like hook-associated protein FlgL|nr:flagellin [Synergistaceae bacterium]